MQCTPNVTLWRVRVTIVAVDTQQCICVLLLLLSYMTLSILRTRLKIVVLCTSTASQPGRYWSTEDGMLQFFPAKNHLMLGVAPDGPNMSPWNCSPYHLSLSPSLDKYIIRGLPLRGNWFTCRVLANHTVGNIPQCTSTLYHQDASSCTPQVAKSRRISLGWCK